MGRPSDFTPETANAICEALIEGKSLRSICRAEDMPSASTVCRWLGQNEEFRTQYAHARDAQADTLADEVLDIADGRDVLDRADLDAQVLNDVAVVRDHNRDRLRIDARKWLAGKMAPKRYGDAVQMKHTGAEGGPVEQVMRWANSPNEATPDPSKS